MGQDILADILNHIMNCKRAGKREVVVTRYSKLLLNVLDIAKKEGYLDYKLEEKNKKLVIKIKELNMCKAIKPRFKVRVKDIEKYMRRFLPARNFGFLIISTNKGLLTHNEAMKEKVGGFLIAYIY